MPNNNDRPHTLIIDYGDRKVSENYENYDDARISWLGYDSIIQYDNSVIVSATVEDENGRIRLYSARV